VIYADWTTFRYAFATKAAGSVAISFVDSNPDTITRAAGSFITSGVEAGMTLDVSGSVSNNQRFTIAAVSALTLTLDASDTVVAEGPVTCDVVAVHRDKDAVETWPIAKVRSGGFTGGFTGIAKPILVVPVSLTVNATALDAVSGTDEYDWWVSQRTDTLADQMLKVWDYHHFFNVVPTRSGTIILALSDLGMSKLGFIDTFEFVTIDQVIRLFRNVHVYCRRISDGAIQWVNVLPYTLS